MEQPFNMKELQEALDDQKTNKSPGPGQMTIVMIKQLGKEAKAAMLDIFNLSWKTGHVSQIWREANMIPINKKARINLIGLISCVGKVMERMISTSLLWHLETNNLIAKEQAGFRHNRSTEDQAAYFAQKVEDGFQETQDTLAV